MKLVVAEKPSVGRDLAKLLGAKTKGKGTLTGNGWTVTWCIGHLIELDEPNAYDPGWKRWSFSTLPMMPEEFRLRPAKRTLEQWRIVRDLLKKRDFETVVNACDAGREGELIFRYAYRRAGSKLPIERLWISSLTPAAIREGFARLAPGDDHAGLASAAQCRSEADWLVGLNATRAMTLVAQRGGVHSVGRVQTPTLGLVVDRELEIEAFVQQPYWELLARLDERAVAKWRAPSGATRLATKALATTLRDRVQPLSLTVSEVSERETRERPPQLFDLTSLQRRANVRYGFSADRTLKAAQKLYERHKAITYPRTSSRYLSSDQRGPVGKLIETLSRHTDYGEHAQRLQSRPLALNARIINDAKVTDHHAIIPTGSMPQLAGDEVKVFDLVARRFLAALHPDARFRATQVVLVAGGRGSKVRRTIEDRLDALPPPPDHFVVSGRVVVDVGWHAVEPPRSGSSQTLPRLVEGQRVATDLTVSEGKTKPPPRYTEATLLGAMETAGKRVEDDALREAMKECGLGTPATRASIIETLIRREYLGRDKRILVPKPKGVALIQDLPVPTLRSAELTGDWEARLLQVARGKHPAERFMTDVRAFVTDAVRRIQASERPPEEVTVIGACPRCEASVEERRSKYECTACPFEVPRRLAGRELGAEDVSLLLRRGRTGTLSGFRSKKKRRFRAALILERGEVRFSFPGKQRESAPPKRSPDSLTALTCPRCQQRGLVAGRRAWGCAHWRDGCGFVVPYVIGGKKLTPKELEDLIVKGKTRKATFEAGKGRIHLEDGAATLRLDPD